ncbi:S1 family serine peptidase [Streptomyces yaizuensis]|uniref:Serine protease n=1 Tax=Streptomyces yaizuensis TaxID=2989713 RepID=A0ABQ5NU89_9ACTN|nr:serine protease [Streptomyces sp. YSPA8]GLF93933.1 serine protease [Streptomyces sp. YSPA8]
MRSAVFQGRTGRAAVTGVAAAAALSLLALAAPAQAGPAGPAGGQSAEARAQAAEPRKNPGARIIGGGAVPNDKYPFMAALLSKGKGSAAGRNFCGGSLVDAFTIMTAAHCVAGADPKGIQVAVGRTVLSNSRQGQIRNVEAITVHPRYAKNPAYDLAFLHLDFAKPVQGIVPVKLPTVGTDALIKPGALATVTGWGATDTDLPETTDRLREVKVPILSHAECEAASEPGPYTSGIDLCAGVEGKDSCWGDSGGPLFRTIKNRETPIQIGVVSRGDGCAAQGGPGIYTSLSSAKLWKTLHESPAGKKIAKRLGR